MQRFDRIRFDGQRSFVGGECIIITGEGGERIAAIEVSLRGARLDRERAIEARDRLGKPLQLIERGAAVEPVGKRSGIERGGAIIACHRGLLVAELGKRVAAVAMCIRKRGGGRDRRIEARQRLAHVSLAMQCLPQQIVRAALPGIGGERAADQRDTVVDTALHAGNLRKMIERARMGGIVAQNLHQALGGVVDRAFSEQPARFVDQRDAFHLPAAPRRCYPEALPASQAQDNCRRTRRNRGRAERNRKVRPPTGPLAS